MADVVTHTPSFLVDATTNYVVGDGSAQNVSTIVAQFVNTGSFSGSIVVKGRARGTDATLVAIPYKRRNLGGSVSDDTTVSAALTAAFLIEINATGLDISFDNTHTSGSGTMYVRRLEG